MTEAKAISQAVMTTGTGSERVDGTARFFAESSSPLGDVAPRESELFARTAAAVVEALTALRAFMASNTTIGRHYKWPTLRRWDNGLPNLASYIGQDGPIDYAGIFRRNGNDSWYIHLEDLHTFDALRDYFRSRDDLRAKLMHPFADVSDFPHEFFEIIVDRFALTLLDRYVHINKGPIYDAERFADIYLPAERAILDDHLPLSVLVPIILLDFAFDIYRLDDNTMIVRLPDDLHHARADIGGSWDNTPVRGSASHALVMTGYTVPNPSDLLSRVAAYPLNKIDLFFAAMRLVNGVDTGYAQLLGLPDGWARRSRAWLPCLEGTSTRAYPPSFDDFQWLQPVKTITVEDAKEIAAVFAMLQVATDNKILIAVRRLNRCYMRNDEEDAVLDAVIGLETLLGDDSKDGIIHRLALRVAGLAKVSARFELTPLIVFRTIKQIYDYRSRLIHGDKKAAGRREIALPGERSERAVNLAIQYLRLVLRELLEHPEYLDPKKIDEDLLIGLVANHAGVT